MRERFINLRQMSGLSQKQLAEYLGIDQSYISKIEKGERALTLDIAEKMALLNGYDVSYFLEENSVEPIQFNCRMQNLTGEDLKYIAEINKIAINLKEMKDINKHAGGDNDEE